MSAHDPCVRGLQQYIGTCYFNAAYNAILLSPTVLQIAMSQLSAYVAQLTDPKLRRDFTDGTALCLTPDILDAFGAIEEMDASPDRQQSSATLANRRNTARYFVMKHLYSYACAYQQMTSESLKNLAIMMKNTKRLSKARIDHRINGGFEFRAHKMLLRSLYPEYSDYKNNVVYVNVNAKAAAATDVSAASILVFHYSKMDLNRERRLGDLIKAMFKGYAPPPAYDAKAYKAFIGTWTPERVLAAAAVVFEDDFLIVRNEPGVWQTFCDALKAKLATAVPRVVPPSDLIELLVSKVRAPMVKALAELYSSNSLFLMSDLAPHAKLYPDFQLEYIGFVVKQIGNKNYTGHALLGTTCGGRRVVVDSNHASCPVRQVGASWQKAKTVDVLSYLVNGEGGCGPFTSIAWANKKTGDTLDHPDPLAWLSFAVLCRTTPAPPSIIDTLGRFDCSLPVPVERMASPTRIATATKWFDTFKGEKLSITEESGDVYFTLYNDDELLMVDFLVNSSRTSIRYAQMTSGGKCNMTTEPGSTIISTYTPGNGARALVAALSMCIVAWKEFIAHLKHTYPDHAELFDHMLMPLEKQTYVAMDANKMVATTTYHMYKQSLREYLKQ